MKISEKEKQKRIELARELDDIFLYFFVLFESEYVAYGQIDSDYYVDWLYRRYMRAARNHMKPDSRFESEAKARMSSIVDTTLKEFAGYSVDKVANESEPPYALSPSRAINISENESNIMLNKAQFDEAEADGKTMKTWLTMMDSRVRESHAAVEGVTVPIDGYFYVNGSLMRYPMDMSMNPDLREVIGCRCSIEYK